VVRVFPGLCDVQWIVRDSSDFLELAGCLSVDGRILLDLHGGHRDSVKLVDRPYRRREPSHVDVAVVGDDVDRQHCQREDRNERANRELPCRTVNCVVADAVQWRGILEESPMRIRFMCPAVCALLLSSGSAANAQVSFGITIGQPPPPRVYVVPTRPSPDFVWVEGYWYPQGRHYTWHDGYWTRPPYAEAYWVAPYYDGRQYIAGYWEGGRGRFEHDHRWDRDRDRRDDRHEERREERRNHRR